MTSKIFVWSVNQEFDFEGHGMKFEERHENSLGIWTLHVIENKDSVKFQVQIFSFKQQKEKVLDKVEILLSFCGFNSFKVTKDLLNLELVRETPILPCGSHLCVYEKTISSSNFRAIGSVFLRIDIDASSLDDTQSTIATKVETECDMIIFTKDDKVLSCHRNIFSASPKLFFPISKALSKSNFEINVPFNLDCLSHVEKFLRTDEVHPADHEIIQLFVAANYFELPLMTLKLALYLENSSCKIEEIAKYITEENCLKIMDAAILTGKEKLMRTVAIFWKGHGRPKFNSFLGTPAWKEFSKTRAGGTVAYEIVMYTLDY